MDKLLALACFILGIVVVATTSSDGSVAMLTTVLFASIAILIIRKQAPDDKLFLTRIFVIGLLARLGFGLFLHIFELRDVFGGDASTYDHFGNILKDYWFGQSPELITEKVLNARMNGVGWGMLYLVAGLYSIIGRNILAAQFFCAVFGAGIAPLLYVCSLKIFKNRRVATVSAILVALYPAFIIWTGQLMKDGLVIFLLVLAMIMVINLQKEISFFSVAMLIFSLFGIISLRFYIFYMIAVATVGTFIIGYSKDSTNLFRRIAILCVLGLSLTYLGVIRYASAEFDKYGSLEVMQNSRDDAATRSESGFGEELDVSTPLGALLAMPVGFTYLLLAPFPWQMSNLRQIITLPDMIIWWLSIPFLISGLIYSIKNRLRASMGILIFSVMLTLVYSVFQGNVGTAYRQRAQIQVFLFIFIGVGWTLYKERRENKNARKLESEREFERNWKLRRKNNLEFHNKTEEDKKVNIVNEISTPDVFESKRSTTLPQKQITESNSNLLKKETIQTNIVSNTKLESETNQSEVKARQEIFRANKEQIKKVQKVLIEKNLYNGKITGKYNKVFRAAIKNYQSEQKLKKTGDLNKVTLREIGIKLTEKQKA